jgi:SAM-dependent methyltransferase
MKNIEKWRPSKFVIKNGHLSASALSSEVALGSRFITNRIAEFYEISIPKYVRGKLVDLGCGKAPLYLLYKNFATEVVCVDWGNSVHKNEYLDFECNLNEPLPFAGESFDTVILSDVLEHLQEPALLWREMARILKIDGSLLMNVPFFYPLHEAPHDFFRYTEFALRNFALKSGFTVVRLEPIGGSFEVLSDFVLKHLQFIPVFGGPLARALQVVCEGISKSAFGKRLAKKTGMYYPLGYSMIATKAR